MASTNLDQTARCFCFVELMGPTDDLVKRDDVDKEDVSKFQLDFF